MPFGSSISCANFQKVSDAISHIFMVKTKGEPNNYLDDFIFVKLMQNICNDLVKASLQLCENIGMPIAIQKMEWGTTIIVSLGMLLDTVNQTVSVPIEKRDKAMRLLLHMYNSSEMIVLRVQQLADLLNHIGCVVPDVPLIGVIMQKLQV